MRTIFFKNKPKIVSTYSVGGPKEGAGPLKEYIDLKLKDDTFGEKTFEKAESKMLFTAIENVLKKSGKRAEDIDSIISGDLLNQIIASTFSARQFDIGYLGIYNACATFTEAMLLGSSLIDGGYIKRVICATSSHFSSAERQYRYPLELGSTRTPLSQWTVTGAGACMIEKANKENADCPALTAATIGKVVDFGVTDVNNMGAAMAPAAADTIVSHFKNTRTNPSDYDLIVSGDLGAFGSRILKDLTWEKGYDIENQHVDCGELIFNVCEDEYQGGSGAGCSSMVFSAYLYDIIKSKKISKILLIATGALLSSLSSQQGESIPGIAHLIEIRN